MTLDDRLRRIRWIICDIDGVLTDGRIFFDGEGRPFRAFHARDVTGLTLWHLAGGQTAILSGLSSKAVEALAAQWRCAECHMSIRDKARVCREIAERHSIPLENMAFLGDDIIDVAAMRSVGLAVAVADAAPEAIAVAHWVTPGKGGTGPLRDLVTAILRAQDRLDLTIEQYCNRRDD